VNERIDQLWGQALDRAVPETYSRLSYSQVLKVKQVFAELIVRDCAVYCEGHILPKGMAEEDNLDYNDGVMDCARGLKTIFGIE